MIVFTDFRRIARLEMRRADCNKRIRKRCCFVQSALLYADRTTEHRKSENQKCRKEFCRALSTIFKSRESHNNERHEKSCCGAAWKNVFFLGIVIKNEHDDAYLCHVPWYVCTPLQITFSQVCDWQTWQGRQTADSLSSFFIQPTAGQRFSLIFCRWAKCQADGTPLNLSYSITTVRRWHNRPLKVILCPNLQDRVKNLPLVIEDKLAFT